MAEGNERSGKSGGFRKSGYGHGSGRPGSRGGNGFKPRGGSRGGYGKSGGFRKDFHRDGDRDFHRDGESGGERRDFRKGPRQGGDRDFRRDGERRGYGKSGGFRKSGGFHKDFHRDGEGRDGERRGGFRKDGFRKDFHRDGDRDFRRGDRDFHRDGESGGERRDFRKGPRQGGDRDFRRDDRRDFRRDDRRGSNPRYQRDDSRREGGERREFTAEEKREYREQKRSEYMRKGPRRNSDGTMSFPSQNPYTDRRPGEPKMPKGMVWGMLSKDEKERLRGLAKEHAENIGLHILAAYTLLEDDPAAALEHAKWVAKQASRIDFARETLAFVAYREGDYKLALKEFRTAYRMNGYLDYLPFMADCERGLDNPKKAIEMAVSDDAKFLKGEAKAEMFLVYAGALADLDHWDKAIEIVHTLGRSKGLAGSYRMRALQAEQLFLEEAGRSDEAAALDQIIERLEDQYADFDEDEESDDVVIDHDLEQLDDPDLLAEIGITEDDAQYAPADEDDEEDEEDASASEDDSADPSDAGDTEPEAETETEAHAEEQTQEESEEGADGESANADETQAPAEAAEDGAESVEEPERTDEAETPQDEPGEDSADESDEPAPDASEAATDEA